MKRTLCIILTLLLLCSTASVALASESPVCVSHEHSCADCSCAESAEHGDIYIAVEGELTDSKLQGYLTVVRKLLGYPTVSEAQAKQPSTRIECMHRFATVGTPSILHLQMTEYGYCADYEIRLFECVNCGYTKDRTMFLGTHPL